MQGTRCQRLSARPSSPGQQGCRDAFLRCLVSGARTGAGIPVEILALANPGLQHHSPREPSFQDSQLLLQGGHEGLSPEGPGVTGELGAAVRLWRCLAGPAAQRIRHMCSEPCLCSAPCFLLLADGATLPPGQEGYF